MINEKILFEYLNEQTAIIKKDFNITQTIILKRDNRIRGAGQCDNKMEEIITIRINSKLHSEELFSYYTTLAHEIGHILDGTDGFCEEGEYQAEKFCFECIKKYYPEEYNRYVLRFERWIPELEKKWPIHYQAFTRLYNNLFWQFAV